MLKGIRGFIERGRKGYCQEDLLNLDYWLSGLIARSIREYKNNCLYYPHDIGNWDEWMASLDEIIECFEEQTRGIGNNPSYIGEPMDQWQKWSQNQRQKLHRGLELLERYWYDLWG